jgi:hypothetical protein
MVDPKQQVEIVGGFKSFESLGDDDIVSASTCDRHQPSS